MSDPDCLFCRIVSGQVPADVVAEGEHVLAFRDINPAAPTHVLVIPREHHPNIGELAAAAPRRMVALVRMAQEIADRECDGRVPVRRQHRSGGPPDRLPRPRPRAGRPGHDLAARLSPPRTGESPRPVTLVVTMADLTTPQPEPGPPDDRDPAAEPLATLRRPAGAHHRDPAGRADGEPARPARRAAANPRAGLPQAGRPGARQRGHAGRARCARSPLRAAARRADRGAARSGRA